MLVPIMVGLKTKTHWIEIFFMLIKLVSLYDHHLIRNRCNVLFNMLPHF
jgi:hypothetical protein